MEQRPILKHLEIHMFFFGADESWERQVSLTDMS